MILANIEGVIGAAVLAVLLFAVQWIADRLTAKNADATQDQRRTQTGPRPGASPARKDSEEERMRRFMEALGIPVEGVEERRPATPPPIRPVQPEAPVKPVPPIVAPSGSPQRVPPVVIQRPPPVPETKVTPPLPVAPSVHDVQPPRLHTEEVRDFQTITSHISAIPGESTPIRVVTRPVASTDNQRESSGRELWREALQSPEGLRSAFILREVLSTPRGLQSF